MILEEMVVIVAMMISNGIIMSYAFIKCNHNELCITATILVLLHAFLSFWFLAVPFG